MKYFIDFEATQYSHEIISVGCVREDGETFKSYVYVKPSKMSSFITQLTGITKDDIRNAPTSDEVFEKFYNWIAGDTDMEFYCYGDADIGFIRTNLTKTKNIYAISALSIIGTNLKDFSQEVKAYFGLHKMIALKKLVAYYRHVDSIEQSHDALEDSLFLKEVYDHMATEEPDMEAFPEYKKDTAAAAEKKKKKKLSYESISLQLEPEELLAIMEEDKKSIGLIRTIKSGKDNWHCDSLFVATMRCIQRVRKKDPNSQVKHLYPVIRAGIIEAVVTGERYHHFYWKIKEEETTCTVDM